MSVTLLGVPAFAAALGGITDAAQGAARKGVTDCGHLLEAATKRKLTTYSHPRGTPTPSPPGRPPAIVSGQLRRSIKVTGPRRDGAGYSVRVGPTAVYGRIQELGGQAGRRGAAHLPARPYLAPALHELAVSGRLLEVYAAAWRAAVGGVSGG